MTIKGVIFDFDGTLLDSMFIWDTMAEDYLLKRGITPEKGLNEKFEIMSLVQGANYYRDHYGITDSVETIIDGVNNMIEDFYTHVAEPKVGVVSMLKELQNRGIKMCIATATDRYLVEAALKHNEMNGYFSHILTCTEVGKGKDSSLIFEMALEKIGIRKQETLVFEDGLHAIKTAKDAGFRVVGVYDKSAHKKQNQVKDISDYYLESYKNWSEVIK
ncbi:MAG TPA: HAD family phosphatase [Epulopiscium sp.]|nr:HAD family phosphatase [Candidatus Epulonipiscium sp.]